MKDCTDIGPHYAMTLRAWRAAWEREHEALLRLEHAVGVGGHGAGADTVERDDLRDAADLDLRLPAERDAEPQVAVLGGALALLVAMAIPRQLPKRPFRLDQVG